MCKNSRESNPNIIMYLNVVHSEKYTHKHFNVQLLINIYIWIQKHLHQPSFFFAISLQTFFAINRGMYMVSLKTHMLKVQWARRAYVCVRMKISCFAFYFTPVLTKSYCIMAWFLYDVGKQFYIRKDNTRLYYTTPN